MPPNRTWADFAVARPDLAAAGAALFRAFTVGYLATVRPDGSPRVHPVTVTLHGEGLYISTILGTRKAYDLRRDGRFALHAFPRFPDETGWSDDEFMVGGRAEEVADPAERSAVLAAHNDVVAPEDPLWHLLLDRAMHKHRVDGAAVIDRWRAGPPRPRLARPAVVVVPMLVDHWPAVREILAAGIATGDATLDPEPPNWKQFDAVHLPDGRWVAVSEDRVLGWTALSPYSRRSVYSRCSPGSGSTWPRTRGAVGSVGRSSSTRSGRWSHSGCGRRSPASSGRTARAWRCTGVPASGSSASRSGSGRTGRADGATWC